MSAQLSYHANRAVCRFATAGEASSLWLLRLLWFAPLPRTKEGSSSSPAAYAAARSQWHSRRGHQAPAPAGCRTLSEYGEQLIIRRSKHKLKDFPLYIPHLSGSRTCGGRRATAARLLRGSCTSAAGSEGRTRFNRAACEPFRHTRRARPEAADCGLHFLPLGDPKDLLQRGDAVEHLQDAVVVKC
jgi:hypothetical protein